MANDKGGVRFTGYCVTCQTDRSILILPATRKVEDGMVECCGFCEMAHELVCNFRTDVWNGMMITHMRLEAIIV
jgi:hypothetical protein